MKMRVVTNAESCCEECGKKYKFTKEMYQIKIFGEVRYICYECVDALFHKTLTATVNYNGKVKSKEDMERIARSKQLENGT